MDIILRRSLPKLREKLLEALQAVLPIVAIVLVLCFSVAPVSPSILLCFLLGAAMIVVGIMFFTLGAEMSMTPMGERVGAVITRSRKLPLILVLGFLLGFLITISEPDLQVLADQVPSIPNMTLILSVAAGVGIFLVMAFLRMLLGEEPFGEGLILHAHNAGLTCRSFFRTPCYWSERLNRAEALPFAAENASGKDALCECRGDASDYPVRLDADHESLWIWPDLEPNWFRLQRARLFTP